jgi:hypothetical protein
MTATVLEIMDAIEALAQTLPDMHATAESPDQVVVPHLIVGAPEISSYRQGLGVRPTYLFGLTLVTSAAISREGQRQLASYADPDGPKSVRELFARNRTLGGLVGDCSVSGFRPLGLEEVGVLQYFGGIFSLTVLVH